jgi:uncharacterized protein (DUF2336 family)
MTMSLAQLQSLARERLPGKRHELLRVLTGVFFESPDLRPQERVLFDDILEKVLDEVEPLARQEFAERLAARVDAPRRVVVKLAGDTIAVAAPVLTYSPVLQDDDLAPLAREKSQDHLLAIAKRPWVSERITDILVDRGNSLVLDSIAENFGAKFSPLGGAALVAKARKRGTLWQRLAVRRDLADCIADQMAPALADSIAAETSRRGVDLDTTQSQALLWESKQTLAKRLRAATAPARSLDELMTLMAEGHFLLCDVVIELADADRVVDLAQLICGRANFESNVFVRHLFAPDVVALMKVCRTALLDLESFSAILRLRRRRRPFGAGDIGRLLRAYQRVPLPQHSGIALRLRPRSLV